MEHHDKHHAAHHDTHKEGEKPEKKHKNRNQFLFPIIILIVGILIGYFFSVGFSKSAAVSITSQQASEKAVDYINSALQGQADVKMVSINESNGLYSMKIDVGGSMYNSFMTKDGKFLFPSGIDLEQQLEKNPQTSISKSDKPKAELFVMSFCPYGVQAENFMKPVVDLLGSKADIKVRFIAQAGDTVDSVQSLHGSVEAKEDLRQLCIMKNYPEKYWDYLAIFNKNCYPVYRNETALDSCWKNSASSAGINATKIELCVSSDGLGFLKADEQVVNSYGVGSSPTLIINGASYNGQRNSEGFKSAVCSAFNNPPAECSQNIGTASQNAGETSPDSGCG